MIFFDSWAIWRAVEKSSLNYMILIKEITGSCRVYLMRAASNCESLRWCNILNSTNQILLACWESTRQQIAFKISFQLFRNWRFITVFEERNSHRVRCWKSDLQTSEWTIRDQHRLLIREAALVVDLLSPAVNLNHCFLARRVWLSSATKTWCDKLLRAVLLAILEVREFGRTRGVRAHLKTRELS